MGKGIGLLKSKEWWGAATVRAIKTGAQTAVAGIGTTSFIEEVSWLGVFSMVGLATIISYFNSLAGLPEVKEDSKNE